ncbi:MAG: virulence RhuM family protein [Coriobacteriaceae bacterium]|nr:virulence RhuM family protein [Coriobacteriaceae bacterium]
MNEQIMIYQTTEAAIEIEVRTDTDTVWLNRQQMADLFGRDVKTIGKHINNALREELADFVVVAKFATTTQHGAMPGKTQTHQVEHYNLDMILSVGYRVKSSEGIRFRQWANTVLKQYLLEGAAINQHRLAQMEKAINILSRSTDDMVSGIANVLDRFSSGLDLLDSYDHQTLAKPAGSVSEWQLTYAEARAFVDSMKFNESSDLFGVERDESFKGIVAGIYQSFGGTELYPSVQEKAANLLYLIVKNHSFTDGNKRIAAALFVYFLDKSGMLRASDGTMPINNSALAAITLMVALSKPEEKEVMCLLVMNMLDARQ